MEAVRQALRLASPSAELVFAAGNETRLVVHAGMHAPRIVDEIKGEAQAALEDARGLVPEAATQLVDRRPDEKCSRSSRKRAPRSSPSHRTVTAAESESPSAAWRRGCCTTPPAPFSSRVRRTTPRLSRDATPDTDGARTFAVGSASGPIRRSFEFFTSVERVANVMSSALDAPSVDGTKQ
jgi:hypothetical protein